jgi:hypothetical protein
MIVVFKTGRSPLTIGLVATPISGPAVRQQQLKQAADI